jgi:hypothetical protein
MINHFLVRLQTDSQRFRSLSEHPAEWVLMFLTVMRKLPKF